MQSYTVNPWITRLESADKIYKSWEQKFACTRLYDYYEGFQWKARTDGPQLNYKPYTLNMVFSTIQIKIANFLFQKPKFVVSPEPGHSHWDLEFAVQSSQLKQDVLNTIVQNRNVKFARNLRYTALDSFFRFGMIEVGYAADWRNPLKDEPYLSNWEDPDQTESQVRLIDQNEVPVNERFFVKRIKPERFRVSVSDAEDLEDHEWVGYWQYFYSDTLKKTPGIKFPKGYESTSFNVDDIGSFSKDSQSHLYLANLQHRGLCKVWHIWDLVAHKRLLILSGYDDEGYELWSQPFERLPLIDLRWVYRLSGFYPVPVVWHWLSAQDEINEAREQIRSYRRRFTRKFQAVKNTVDEEELEKFVSGPDGIVVEVKQPDAIKAIDNPEIGPTSEGALLQAKDDFNTISATSAEARGQNADRETATQAKLIDARAQIRESFEQLDFSEFVGVIGQELLSQAKEKLVGGLWIKYTSDPGQNGVMQDMQVNGPIIKWITSSDLDDGYDSNVRFDVINATPAAMQAEELAFNKFVAMLTQFPMLALSPALIREAAYRCGYKNELIIHQMQQVAVLHMAAQAAQASQAQGVQGASGQNSANTAKAQMATPDQNQISNQINEQIQ